MTRLFGERRKPIKALAVRLSSVLGEEITKEPSASESNAMNRLAKNLKACFITIRDIWETFPRCNSARLLMS